MVYVSLLFLPLRSYQSPPHKQRSERRRGGEAGTDPFPEVILTGTRTKHKRLQPRVSLTPTVESFTSPILRPSGWSSPQSLHDNNGDLIVPVPESYKGQGVSSGEAPSRPLSSNTHDGPLGDPSHLRRRRTSVHLTCHPFSSDPPPYKTSFGLLIHSPESLTH